MNADKSDTRKLSSLWSTENEKVLMCRIEKYELVGIERVSHESVKLSADFYQIINFDTKSNRNEWNKKI